MDKSIQIIDHTIFLPYLTKHLHVPYSLCLILDVIYSTLYCKVRKFLSHSYETIFDLLNKSIADIFA